MGVFKGKLITIESGVDASGKATQAKRLYDRLLLEGYKVIQVSYPNYDSESSALVKMYLNGDFGKNPEDVNPYVASTFYAVDRYASYKREWEDFYINGGIVIADRYTTSNMVHQAAKISGLDKDKFLDWIWNLEFEMYELPIPSCVIFLDMPPDISQELMKNRPNKITGDIKKDIHESNKQYLINSYNNAKYVAERYNWNKIYCTHKGKTRTIEDIHEDIYRSVLSVL
jgi:dTMP kinase